MCVCLHEKTSNNGNVSEVSSIGQINFSFPLPIAAPRSDAGWKACCRACAIVMRRSASPVGPACAERTNRVASRDAIIQSTDLISRMLLLLLQERQSARSFGLQLLSRARRFEHSQRQTKSDSSSDNNHHTTDTAPGRGLTIQCAARRCTDSDLKRLSVLRLLLSGLELCKESR